ncbi:L-fucose dehydrogenase [Pedobacter sp. KBW01]|uniref:aldo/keto reductase n=1 Tax=Pedobacter sp. KBW01 TaxID=2153364 RepID=UPI000F5AA217|nr:aldo/keto reductase [Pedobacter sp. KBW01]RQO66648.1 L-fucose dehydrogenase [Pedobacter sp. KBW01]
MTSDFPKVIFGTSALGNLYTALTIEQKREIVYQIFKHAPRPLIFDSAGKYGAGLALESLAECLESLHIDPADVVISNKLGWYRTPLLTQEPTFEPGVWRDLKHDAVQKISYQGIIDCFEQGNTLLGKYKPKMVSVHDCDEYLATAQSPENEQELYNDIIEAYRALQDLKKEHNILIGVGAKSWQAIKKVAEHVNLDWVMFANSMTIKSHPPELIKFMEQLNQKGVKIINSAVFHAGFLTGGDYYDYRLVKDSAEDLKLIKWRTDFFVLCGQFKVRPASACIQFALAAPGVTSIALSTSNAARIKENISMAEEKMPAKFWQAIKDQALIADHVKFI